MGAMDGEGGSAILSLTFVVASTTSKCESFAVATVDLGLVQSTNSKLIYLGGQL